MKVAEGLDREQLTMLIQVERAADWFGAAESYAVGVRVDDGSRERVLARTGAAPGQREEVLAGAAVAVPAALSADAALLVPPVVSALRAWDGLGLEIGAAAVVTPGAWSPVLSLVAGWYGATPIVAGASGASGGVDSEAVAALAGQLQPFPVVCVAELTGRADMVDLLLESIPKYARVLFAGPRGDALTIDYYVNVHRKGLHLSSTILSAVGMFAEPIDRSLVARASQLLMNPDRVAGMHAAVATVQRLAPSREARA